MLRPVVATYILALCMAPLACAEDTDTDLRRDLALDLAKEGGCLTPKDQSPTELPQGDAPRDATSARDLDADAGDLDAGDLDTRTDVPADLSVDIQGGDSAQPKDSAAAPCPPCMALVTQGALSFCIDRYEASRPDATATQQGVATGPAQCRAGVLPWWTTTLGRQEAQAACAAAGKALCSGQQWTSACAGPQQTTYSYGPSYDPVICNGIDRFCACGAGSACATVSPCPYPRCYDQPPPNAPPGQGACGSTPHEVPTGSHPSCHNAWGLYDMNGNVWEVTEDGDGQDHFRGGAFNCIDSPKLHRCDSDLLGGVWARGFRCCAPAQLPAAG